MKMDANGSNVRRLTFNSAREWYPAYSADATLIVFMSDREHTFQIYAMNADGTGQVRLTEGNLLEGQPAWRPDTPLESSATV